MKKLIVDVTTNTSTIKESNEVLVYKNEYNTVCVSDIVPSNEELLKLSEYNVVELGEQYLDCMTTDFNDDLTFNIEKYNARKQKELNQLRIAELTPRLEKLSQDLIQAQAGAIIKDLEARKLEFQTIHNEIRALQGKEARPYASPVSNEIVNEELTEPDIIEEELIMEQPVEEELTSEVPQESVEE